MGYLHVYTGNGKGKTTCAVGLAVRALGAGLRVAMIQFDKGYDGSNEHYSERKVLRRLEGIDLYPFGLERMMPSGKFRFENTDEDIAQARAALDQARLLVDQLTHDLVILDEIVTCVGTKLLVELDVMQLLLEHKSRGKCELVLTGRGAWPALIEAADLVTDMTLVKHYWYEHKVEAREGIDF